MKGYKIAKELKDVTPQIIREWKRETPFSELYLVKRQILYCCPLTDNLVTEVKCQNCSHNYGAASSREIYCMPQIDKVRSVRAQRKGNRERGD